MYKGINLGHESKQYPNFYFHWHPNDYTKLSLNRPDHYLFLVTLAFHVPHHCSRVSLGKVGQLATVGQLTSITSHKVTVGHNRFTSTPILRLFLTNS